MTILPRTRKVLKIIWLYVCIWSIIVYITSSLSSFIPPSGFSYISLFAIGFPYILACYFICSIVSLFIVRRIAYVMLLLLPAGYFNFVTTFALRKELSWQTHKDESTLRIMTWNVQSFANYLHKKQSAYHTAVEGMLQTIHSYDPDVLCFQEYKNIENSKKRIPIKKELDSMGYKFYYCSNDIVAALPKNPSVVITNGVAIFSKLPILDSSRMNINHFDKNENFIYADILFNNKPLRVITAHMQSFTIYGDTSQNKNEDENIYEITYKRRSTAQYKIRETEVNHEYEVATIRKLIDTSSYPVIYCGDLNTTPTSYNYRYLKGNNLQDAFLKKGSGIGNTFYKICPTLRIDVCLADTAFEITQCKRERKKISDHFPVITDVRWKH